MMKLSHRFTFTGIITAFSLMIFIFSAGCTKQVKTENSDENNNGKISSDVNKSDSKNGKTEVSEKSTKIPAEYEKLVGKYKLEITGYTGELIFKYENSNFSGTIFFKGWGKGVPQPLKKLKIKDTKIYFIRSISSREEMKKYGGTRYFTQKFVGAFSKDGKVIKGNYVISGSIANWKAYK